jgi:DnaJ-class molecular chaperone
METDKQPPCPTCGGTGQISFFQGESRFLLTDEECPACCGLGYILEEQDPDPQADNPSTDD